MAVNHWKQQGIPHKGWQLLDVIDARYDGHKASETNYEICMMCGREKIRFVHIVKHSDMNEEFRVGCNCAEKMTEDYTNPEKRERELRNRANRIKKWSTTDWTKSRNGTYFMEFEEHLLLIFKSKDQNKFKAKIGGTFGRKLFDSLEEAKTAIFLGIEYLKRNGMW